MRILVPDLVALEYQAAFELPVGMTRRWLRVLLDYNAEYSSDMCLDPALARLLCNLLPFAGPGRVPRALLRELYSLIFQRLRSRER